MRSKQLSGSALVWQHLDRSLAPIALETDEKDIFSNPFHQLQLFNKNFCVVPIAFLHETSFTSVFKIERMKVKIDILVWWHSQNPDPDTEIQCWIRDPHWEQRGAETPSQGINIWMTELRDGVTCSPSHPVSSPADHPRSRAPPHDGWTRVVSSPIKCN